MLWNTGYTKAFFKQALRFVVSGIVEKGVLLIYTGNGPKFALTYMRIRNFGDCCEYIKDCCLGPKSQMMGLVLFSINTNRKAVLIYRQFYLSLNQRAGVADEVFGHVRTILADPGEGNGFLLVTDLVDVLKSAFHLVDSLRGLLADERNHLSCLSLKCSLNAENTGCNGLLAVRVREHGSTAALAYI